MSTDRSWTAADLSALAWLEAADLGDGGRNGYDVGPLPDRVFVLHPLTERIDGEPMDAGYESGGPGAGSVFVGSAPEPATRSLRWDEYARRRNIPMFTPPYWPSLSGALPGVWDDDYVDSPAWGDLSDVTPRDALLDLLVRHTPLGAAEWGTALWDWFWLLKLPPPPASSPDEFTSPPTLRGSLGEMRELFDRPGYRTSPQNIWPDDHSWVLYTDSNAWATVISGSVDLVEDILGCRELKSCRLPELR